MSDPKDPESSSIYIYTTVGLKVEKDELQNPRDYLNCYVQINNIILNILFIN